jgi:hypothetical protein
MDLHHRGDATEAISEEFTSDSAETDTEQILHAAEPQPKWKVPESVNLIPIEVDFSAGEGLPLDELQLLAHYRALGTVPRLAVRRYLTAGDDRLVVAIYHQAFLGLRPR